MIFIRFSVYSNLCYEIKHMKVSILISALLSLFSISACSQKTGNTKQWIGGRCEGCEAIYEQAPAFDKLTAVDTLPDFNEPGPKIEISGIVYQRDGKTPARDVVIYIYHTDQGGHYTQKKTRKAGQGAMDIYVAGLKQIKMVIINFTRFDQPTTPRARLWNIFML